MTTDSARTSAAEAALAYLARLDDDGLLNDPDALRMYLRAVRGEARDIARILAAYSSFSPESDGARTQTLLQVLADVVGTRRVSIEASSAAAGAIVDAQQVREAVHVLIEAHQGTDVRLQVSLADDRNSLELCVLGNGERHQALVPLFDAPTARQARARREDQIHQDESVLSALAELRSARAMVERERTARELAEAQQVRAVHDFRAAHAQALRLAERLDNVHLETITALARAVEARDDYTGGHVERVRRYSLGIAADLGLDGDAARFLEFGAVLHDVGKIGIPDAILRKPAQLDIDEWRLMRRHPEIGRRVMGGIAALTPALDAVASHHERWDGRGYPDGLGGSAIPLAGRIVAVADAFDAMTTDRPYRAALAREVVLAEIERGRGSQFDPDVAAAFLRWLASPS
jgi:HD-GYP domain-containing protein (c-di-GMP phosphodiesterase class II)